MICVTASVYEFNPIADSLCKKAINNFNHLFFNREAADLYEKIELIVLSTFKLPKLHSFRSVYYALCVHSLWTLD